MSAGIDLIAAERQRQIEAEGWTPEHDAGHTLGELAAAGACYALLGTRWRDASILGAPLVRSLLWPWDDEWFKPAEYGDPPYHANIHRDKHVKDLVRAGALIAAEIDRLSSGDATRPTPVCSRCPDDTDCDCPNSEPATRQTGDKA